MIHISLTISQGQGYHSFRQYFILSYHFTCFDHFLAVKYVLENLELFFLMISTAIVRGVAAER